MKDQLQFCLSALSFSFFPFNLSIIFFTLFSFFLIKILKDEKERQNESWRTVTSSSLAEVEKKRL